jgi:hypothetical protein
MGRKRGFSFGFGKPGNRTTVRSDGSLYMSRKVLGVRVSHQTGASRRGKTDMKSGLALFGILAVIFFLAVGLLKDEAGTLHFLCNCAIATALFFCARFGIRRWLGKRQAERDVLAASQ